jgi:hypothetical protein
MQLDCVLYEKVCKFLWNEWDPIGVNGLNGPSDEYDSHAASLIRLVQNGADEFAVARRLDQLATESMGLSPINCSERDRKVARGLIDLVRG